MFLLLDFSITLWGGRRWLCLWKIARIKIEAISCGTLTKDILFVFLEKEEEEDILFVCLLFFLLWNQTLQERRRIRRSSRIARQRIGWRKEKERRKEGRKERKKCCCSLSLRRWFYRRKSVKKKNATPWLAPPLPSLTGFYTSFVLFFSLDNVLNFAKSLSLLQFNIEH